MCYIKCGSQNVIRSGFVKGQQRYRYKDCCYQFVPIRHHGKSEQEKPYNKKELLLWKSIN